MSDPTAPEQLTLELINQARLNPHREFDRLVTNASPQVQAALDYYHVDLAVLKAQFDQLVAVAPLAWNANLGDSSQAHTDLMLANDLQSHNLPGEPGLGERVEDAGYQYNAIGENIYAFASSAEEAFAAFFIDWGNTSTGIQNPPGHRNNIMDAAFKEAGVGWAVDLNPNTDVGPNLVTHHLGSRFGYTAQITGVVYNDTDANAFYSIGEGQGGVIVQGPGGATTTWTSGGYNLASGPGLVTLSFAGSISVNLLMGSSNAKVDLVDAQTVRSSVTATLLSGATNLVLLGETSIGGTGNQSNNVLTGSDGNNSLLGQGGADTLTGARGNDTLDGGNGFDTAVFAGVSSQYTISHGSGSTYFVVDSVAGRDGADTLTGIERFTFADKSIDFFTVTHSPVAFTHAGFSPGAGGWVSMDTYPRDFVDVNGDGLEDVVGFGYAGTYVALGTGAGQGTFGGEFLAAANFGSGPNGGSWVSQGHYPRLLGDINGDGRADIVGFGGAGVYVALGQANGAFGAASFALANFGADPNGGSWVSEDHYPRILGDVNGDGRADIVGFGDAGVYVALSNGDGTFGTVQFALGAFGGGPSGGDWASNDRYPRTIADIDGDGDGDLVGFGDSGVYVALSNGNGTFASPALVVNGYGAGGAGGGWASQNTFPRLLADLNADGADDIVGFGGAGAYASLANGAGGFGPSELILANFGAEPGAGSWVDNTTYPRFATDLNGDGFADLVGIGDAGIYTSMTLPEVFIA